MLVEGAKAAKKAPFILEVKEEGPAILETYFDADKRAPAVRVAENQRVASPGGDPFCGWAQSHGKSFLVRERNPHKLGVDLTTLSADDLVDYARACGQVLARAHARSTVDGKHSARKAILAALDDRFVGELIGFGAQEATRVTADYAAYASQWAKGKFAVRR